MDNKTYVAMGHYMNSKIDTDLIINIHKLGDDDKLQRVEASNNLTLDHCFLYGDGVFEGIRVLPQGLLYYHEHINRLIRSANRLRLKIGERSDLQNALMGTLRTISCPIEYLRIIWTRGIGKLGIRTNCSQPLFVIIAAPKLELFPDEGIDLLIARTRKPPIESFDCSIKSCNYLNNIMATLEYEESGRYHEAIMLDCHGFVSEGTVDNVFWVANDRLFTPSPETNCLQGITRARVISIARDAGIDVNEGKFLPEEILSADEAFLTGTGAGIVPVKSINQMKLRTGTPGKVTSYLRSLYENCRIEGCTPLDR